MAYRLIFLLFPLLVFGAEPRDSVIETLLHERCALGVLNFADLDPHFRAKELFSLLTHLRKISEEPQIEKHVEAAVVAKFEDAIRTGKPIQMYIPCFPAKSPNHVGKTLGPYPDMAERIAVERLSAVIDAMNRIHKTELVIASDGRMFADTWWTSDSKVNIYRDELRAAIKSPQVKLLDLNQYFPGLSPEQGRDKIMREYAPSVEEVKKSIETDPERKALYLAFIKFIEGDTPPDDPALVGLGSNAKKRLFKERAIEDIRRSDALNKFLVDYFVKEKKFIRLSIRDSVDTPDKIGINLLDSKEREFSVSPWHSVIVVFPDGRYEPMKRSEAEAKGYKLIYRNGRPDHFEAPQ